MSTQCLPPEQFQSGLFTQLQCQQVQPCHSESFQSELKNITSASVMECLRCSRLFYSSMMLLLHLQGDHGLALMKVYPPAENTDKDAIETAITCMEVDAMLQGPADTNQQAGPSSSSTSSTTMTQSMCMMDMMDSVTFLEPATSGTVTNTTTLCCSMANTTSQMNTAAPNDIDLSLRDFNFMAELCKEEPTVSQSNPVRYEYGDSMNLSANSSSPPLAMLMNYSSKTQNHHNSPTDSPNGWCCQCLEPQLSLPNTCNSPQCNEARIWQRRTSCPSGVNCPGEEYNSSGIACSGGILRSNNTSESEKRCRTCSFNTISHEGYFFSNSQNLPQISGSQQMGVLGSSTNPNMMSMRVGPATTHPKGGTSSTSSSDPNSSSAAANSNNGAMLEPKFNCTQCGRTFRQKIHLRKHIASQHYGDRKPYQCPTCEYSTVEKSHLTVHVRKHTGEKPFQCRNCEYSSAQNCTLKNHYFRKHPASRTLCPSCSKEFVTDLERENHSRSCSVQQTR